MTGSINFLKAVKEWLMQRARLIHYRQHQLALDIGTQSKRPAVTAHAGVCRMQNSRPVTDTTVLILMAVLNGARFLQEQLDSISNQTHRDWQLLAADDGSRDASLDILSAFAENQKGHVTISKGPQTGFARNFMQLIQNAPNAPYIALCDQDDVWYPPKLARAVAALDNVPADRPALYCSSTMICHQNLAPVRLSETFPERASFRNALAQNIGGGNTMVLNRAGHQLAASAAAICPDPIAHDWWLYQIITACGGIVIRDPEASLLYRQHDDNLIGARLTAGASIRHRWAILTGKWQNWNPKSLAAIAPIRDQMTSDSKDVFDKFNAARIGPVWRRLRNLWGSGVYRQSISGTLAIYVLCALGRL